MICPHPALAWLASGVFALAALFCVPQGIEAWSLLAAADDPVAIADRGLDRTFDAGVAVHEIEAALEIGDADLAQSFADLASDRGTALPAALKHRVRQAVDDANSAGAVAGSLASGFISGEPKDIAGFAGAALGDLFVFGDIRDAVREGGRYASGELYDPLILGLAGAGIAITAGTYATVGGAMPARLGLTVFKAARKAGVLSGRMVDGIGRSLALNWAVLRRGANAVAAPVVAMRAAKEAVKIDKASGLIRLAGDVAKVQAKAGTQAALDGLKLAAGPRELSRVAALAEKKGSKTRAILKTLGRSAIFLSVASFNLAGWILGAILTLFGFVSSAKAGVERMTLRHLARKKQRAAGEILAAQGGIIFARA